MRQGEGGRNGYAMTQAVPLQVRSTEVFAREFGRELTDGFPGGGELLDSLSIKHGRLPEPAAAASHLPTGGFWISDGWSG